MIVSLFSEARVSSPSIIYIEGIEVITSIGVSQILYEMESCENDGAVFVVIGTVWSTSKKQEGERKQVEKGDKQQERKERSRKQEKFSKNFEQVDPIIGGVLRGGRTVKDGVLDQACNGDHKNASSKDYSFVWQNVPPQPCTNIAVDIKLLLNTTDISMRSTHSA
ncbi:hypothetical protein Tco_0769651 [Tanacetum coccineum]|uniref:Uncharacterized protein n=1 Tax=Tanacetum coccineum TaxID=301880 RepID=A0ABQ4ZAB2_9ASTR